MNIKLFADGASTAEIAALRSDSRVAGFTTNPTLMRQAGVKNYLDFARQIVELVASLPISLEVIVDSLDEMGRQARVLASLGANVYTKIPVTTTSGESTAELCRSLAGDGISLNVTAVFTRKQVEDVLGALDGGAPSVLSVFAGRIADAGIDPVPVMREYASFASSVPTVELLWASPREILNVVQAEQSGCQIITMTPDLWRKLDNLGKDLEEFSLDTVKMFFKDATDSGYDF
jgi:transaldolase